MRASGQNSLSRGIELPSVEYRKKATPPTVRCDIGTTSGMDFNLACEVRNSGQILRELRSDITIVYQVNNTREPSRNGKTQRVTARNGKLSFAILNRYCILPPALHHMPLDILRVA